jgi:hypothetical protein
MHPAGAVAGLLPLAVAIVGVPWLTDFFRQTRTPDALGRVFIGLVIVGFGVLPAMTVLGAFRRSRRGGTIVRVSARGIEIHERDAWAAPVKGLDRGRLTSSTWTTARTNQRSPRPDWRPNSRQWNRQARRRQRSAPHRASSDVAARFATNRGLTVRTRTG